MTKRRIGVALAAAFGSLGLLLAAPVIADPGGRAHDGGRGWGRAFEGRGYDRVDHAPRPSRGDSRERDDRTYPPRGDGGRFYVPDGRACGGVGRCGDGRFGYAMDPRRNWRRGEFLPQPYWSGGVDDPRRHRLRAPPPGYAWYGVGRDAYLVQRSTGLILDTAPGAW